MLDPGRAPLLARGVRRLTRAGRVLVTGSADSVADVAATASVAAPVTPPDPLPGATFVSHDPRGDFWTRGQPIERRHRAQTVATVEALREKYQAPVFGEVRVWDLIERLALCIDPTDTRLYNTSQLVHVLQVIEGMAHDGVTDDDMLLCALIHDLGKLLLLTDEDPAHIVCMNSIIGHPEAGAGLDRCTLQWNHDELGWSRFRDLVPDHVAWMIRYHSIDIDACAPFMDDRDLLYAERHLRIFSRYDHETKSAHLRPSIRLDSYRDLIEAAFPAPVLF